MDKEIIEKCRKELELILFIKSIDDITFNNIINLITSEKEATRIETLKEAQLKLKELHYDDIEWSIWVDTELGIEFVEED